MAVLTKYFGVLPLSDACNGIGAISILLSLIGSFITMVRYFIQTLEVKELLALLFHATVLISSITLLIGVEKKCKNLLLPWLISTAPLGLAWLFYLKIEELRGASAESIIIVAFSSIFSLQYYLYNVLTVISHVYELAEKKTQNIKSEASKPLKSKPKESLPNGNVIPEEV